MQIQNLLTRAKEALGLSDEEVEQFRRMKIDAATERLRRMLTMVQLGQNPWHGRERGIQKRRKRNRIARKSRRANRGR